VKPTLFHIGSGSHPIEVHSYGLFIAFGLLLGVALAVWRGRRVGIDTSATLDLTFYAVAFGMVGSRLLYVLVHAGEYARLCAGTAVPRSFGQRLWDCTAALHIWQGGLVFLGGAVLGACAALVIARRKGLGLGLVADVLAPSVSLAHLFGRLGCFMVGCCYGKPLSGGVRFPPDSVAFGELVARGALLSDASCTYGLHPTQIYEAAGELIIFAALLWLWRRRKVAGTVATAYAFGYGLLRFLVEIFRGDQARGFLLQVRAPSLARALALPANEPLFLSSAQMTAILLMALAAVLYRLLHRRGLTAG
jgi:phosphatidylglycerol---prolipoprotein diacylglyceryl transferase